MNNGNDSENESDYVEINVASIAARAKPAFHDGSENGEEDDPGMEDHGAASDQELDPLSGELLDVKHELIGSDGSDVDLHEVRNRPEVMSVKIGRLK